MNRKHKSARMYTHTHTIKFVCRLRTFCGRCAPWVSAFWRGIRRQAGRSGTGRTPGTGRTCVKSVWVSHPNGCWCLTVGTYKATAILTALAASRYQVVRLGPLWILSTLLLAVLMSIIMRRPHSAPTHHRRFTTTFTATNAAGKAVA